MSYTLLEPNLVILCFDIKNRRSLVSAQQVWRKKVIRHYEYNNELPVMLLGLKRDLRVEEDGVIYPQEVSTIDYWWTDKYLVEY